MGPTAEPTAPEKDHRQRQAGEDVALLRPFLATVGVGMYTVLLLGTYSSFAPPYVPGWDGRIPYFSRWEIALPWLCLTAGLAAYLTGAVAVRLFGKAFLGTLVAAVAAVVLWVPLSEAVQLQDRDYAENYSTCRQLTEVKYMCEGTKHWISEDTPEMEKQAILRTGPPPYPHRYGFFAAVSLGAAVFSAAPRLRRPRQRGTQGQS